MDYSMMLNLSEMTDSNKQELLTACSLLGALINYNGNYIEVTGSLAAVKKVMLAAACYTRQGEKIIITDFKEVDDWDD